MLGVWGLQTVWDQLDFMIIPVLLQEAVGELSEELMDLVVYCKAVHFNGFQHAWSKDCVCELSSFSENKAKKLITESGKTTHFYNGNTTVQITPRFEEGSQTESSPIPSLQRYLPDPLRNSSIFVSIFHCGEPFHNPNSSQVRNEAWNVVTTGQNLLTANSSHRSLHTCPYVWAVHMSG